MTVDFMSVKTVSSSSLKAEKEAARKTQQEKTQALEQVREYLKYFTPPSPPAFCLPWHQDLF